MMFALLRRILAPEADSLPVSQGRDSLVTYWAHVRDANPYAWPLG